MARKRKRKIKGVFCERKLAPKASFDDRSFRFKPSGKAWVLVGCPHGKWSAKRDRCKAGLRAYTVLTPRRGARCPVGAIPVRK